MGSPLRLLSVGGSSSSPALSSNPSISSAHPRHISTHAFPLFIRGRFSEPRRLRRQSQKKQTRVFGVGEHGETWRSEAEKEIRMMGFEEEVPTQAQSLVEGSSTVVVSEYKPIPDLDYLQELLAIQQQGSRAIGFFGTRNMGFMHQQLIEILSYAMVITKNHIYTSGASGTNAAVIRGALRAEKPELLTVILPQSLKKQSPESQELLSKVKNLVEKPENDHLPLIEASRLCNYDIISHVQQLICFAFHDSRLLMETCQEAKRLRKIVTLFYLD